LDAERGAILVTGGAGYIGSHAAKSLVRAGRHVVVYDNLSAGHRQAVQWCDLVVGDLHDRDLLRETIDRYRVSAVMHFAARASVGESVRDPSGYYRNNVEGTLALLRTMIEASVLRLVVSPYGLMGRVACPSVIGTSSGSPYTAAVDENTSRRTDASIMVRSNASVPSTLFR
jgi:UDP-arabinose 4-epimerase